MQLVLSDESELLALQRALMEVRYSATDVDDAVRGSAFLSGIHVRVIDALKAIAVHHAKIGDATRWEEWLQFSDRSFERQSIVDFIVSEFEGSAELDSNLIRECVVIQMRPFNFSSADVDDVVAEVMSSMRPE